MPGAAGYNTLEDAAAAALKHISDKYDDSHKREYIGLLYQDPSTGKYIFTEPNSQDKKERTKGTFAIPKGSARGIYHNHPVGRGAREGNDKDRSLFSSTDMDVAQQTGLMSFISAGDDIYRWDPQNPGRVDRRGRGADRNARGTGTPVLAQIAMDLLPQKRMTQMMAKR